MKDHFLNLAVEQKIKLAGILGMEPKQLDFDQEFIYEVEYEVYPDITAKVPKGVELELVTAEVTDEDIERTIDDMRRRAAKLEDVIIGVEASKEHIAVVSYQAETNDEEKQQFAAEDTNVELSGDYPSEDFVAAIIGMRAEQDKSFTVKVPVSPAAKEGEQPGKVEDREVNFRLSLKQLKRRVLPEIGPEFFKLYGITGDEQEFRRQVKMNMEFELQRALSKIRYTAISKSIVESNKDMQVPASQITREAYRMREQAVNMWGQMGGGNNSQIPDVESIPLDMFKERADERIRAGLFLGELARKESLAPTDAEVEKNIAEMAEAYENPAEVKKKYTEDQAMREQIYNKMLEDRAIDKYIAMAGASAKKIKYQEALARSAATGV